MQNTAATLQDSLVVSYTTAHALTVRSGGRALWPLSREDENLCSHRNLHTNVYSSFICNCWNLKATEMLFTRWVDENWSIQTVGYYSALKRNERTRRNLKCMLLSEKANPKRLAYCVVLTTWRSAKGRTMATVKRPVVIRGWGRVKDE